MNTFLIYVGIALIILIASILVFKPEFSLITGTTNPDSRIVSITQTGDLVLSDNTVQNINDYIAGMADSISKLQTAMDAAIGKETTDRKTAINTLENVINGVSKTMNQDFVRYNDEMQIAGTYGCGQYQNISTGPGPSVANSAPLGPNDPNPRFVIRKRCGGCDVDSNGSNVNPFKVNRGSDQAWGPVSGCKGFTLYNNDGSVKRPL